MSSPTDLQIAIDAAWAAARDIHGYIGEMEFGALAMLHAAAPAKGVTVEIGSFKGKSTVGLAAISARYGLGPVVSIDPHDAPSETCPDLGEQSTSYDDFLANLRKAGVEDQVEIHRSLSRLTAREWDRPIRFLWIDGDHTYAGAKLDFESFLPHLADGAIVAIHDTLHEFEGPIRVFVEDVLRSDKFGPAFFFHTIAWAQYRPADGAKFRPERERLARRAARLIPLVRDGRRVTGRAKMLWKWRCALVPHRVLPLQQWEGLLAK